MTSSVGVDKARPERIDVRFGKIEIKIHDALHEVLRMRRVDIRSTEFCRMAQISRPTLKAHCAKVDDALRQYEQNLRERFVRKLIAIQDEKMVFEILLSMIRNAYGYFGATIPNHDYWLLNAIFKDLRIKLAGDSVDDLDYELYVHRQIAIISCWVKFDDCASERISFYAKELKGTKVAD